MSAGQLVASLFGVLSLQDKMTPGLKQAESNLERFGGAAGGVTDKIGALTSAMKAIPAAGARAEGGPIGPGMWLVGEKGPELLMLGGGQSGQVISNKALRGGGSGSNGGPQVNIQTVVLQGVSDPEELLNKLEQLAGRSNIRLGAAT